MAIHKKRRRKGRKQGAPTRHEQLRRHGEQRVEGKPTHNRGEAAAIRHHDNGKRQNAHLGKQVLRKRHLHVDRHQHRKRHARVEMRGAALADAEDRVCTTALEGKGVSIKRAM